MKKPEHDLPFAQGSIWDRMQTRTKVLAVIGMAVWFGPTTVIALVLLWRGVRHIFGL